MSMGGAGQGGDQSTARIGHGENCYFGVGQSLGTSLMPGHCSIGNQDVKRQNLGSFMKRYEGRGRIIFDESFNNKGRIG